MAGAREAPSAPGASESPSAKPISAAGGLSLAARSAEVAIGLVVVARLILARTVREWRLLAVSLLGLVAAVGLAAAVPLYSYGALDRLLQTRVASRGSV
jgi:hypothetical protein